jgi:hypothetical protein
VSDDSYRVERSCMEQKIIDDFISQGPFSTPLKVIDMYSIDP